MEPRCVLIAAAKGRGVGKSLDRSRPVGPEPLSFADLFSSRANFWTSVKNWHRRKAHTSARPCEGLPRGREAGSCVCGCLRRRMGRQSRRVWFAQSGRSAGGLNEHGSASGPVRLFTGNGAPGARSTTARADAGASRQGAPAAGRGRIASDDLRRDRDHRADAGAALSRRIGVEVAGMAALGRNERGGKCRARLTASGRC